MRYNPDVHHRRSIRLKNYDYSSNGMYFVTMCTQDRAMLFGNVMTSVGADLVSAPFAKMVLNNAGKMVESLYYESVNSFSDMNYEKHVIMPNHIHGLIAISGADTANNRADTRSAPTGALFQMIQAFKSKTTVRYTEGVKSGVYAPFDRRIWQRNYYEHVIRNAEEYQQIWQYIDENPSRWENDKYFA